MHNSNAQYDPFGLNECLIDDGKHVYRFDERSPDQIKKAGGFDAWGRDMDIYKHADGTNIGNRTSGYVSTSKYEAVPKDWATGYDEGYIYKIKRPSNGIDVNNKLGDLSPFKNEHEIAIPNKVPFEDIVSWQNPF